VAGERLIVDQSCRLGAVYCSLGRLRRVAANDQTTDQIAPGIRTTAETPERCSIGRLDVGRQTQGGMSRRIELDSGRDTQPVGGFP
jgi:hypothetical protein